MITFDLPLLTGFADSAETAALSKDLASFVRKIRPGEAMYFVACFADVTPLTNQRDFTEKMHRQIDQLEEISRIFFPDDYLVGFEKPNDVHQLHFSGKRLNVVGLFANADDPRLNFKRPTLIFAVCEP